jgi:hypothetical protein
VKFSKKVLQVRILIVPLLFTNLSATLQYYSVNLSLKKIIWRIGFYIRQGPSVASLRRARDFNFFFVSLHDINFWSHTDEDEVVHFHIIKSPTYVMHNVDNLCLFV